MLRVPAATTTAPETPPAPDGSVSADTEAPGDTAAPAETGAPDGTDAPDGSVEEVQSSGSTLDAVIDAGVFRLRHP